MELVTLYEHNARQIPLPLEFNMPFSQVLDPENRWVKYAEMIPWAVVEDLYKKALGNSREGQRAYPARLAFGALFIQNKKGLSDKETVQAIVEGPYLQYFIGLKDFITHKPFDPSLMTHFRKRFGKDIINEINELMFREKEEETKGLDDDEADDYNDTGQTIAKDNSSKNRNNSKQIENKGGLVLDATCTPVDIQYPTDTRLLNEAREALEGFIDTLHEPHIGKRLKPRTYRQIARKEYLRFARKRRHTRKDIRQTNRKQLGYVRRNLKTIDKMLKAGPLKLSKQQMERLATIKKLYAQQYQMHKEKVNSIPDRIVSISMPFVRPIVRGKKRAPVEFGPKLAVSVVNGFVFEEKLSFDAFNEGTTLISSVEKYKECYGYYPAAVYADGIYRNRENRRYCSEKGIRLSGPPLGRPTKDPVLLKQQRKEEREDAKIRNCVEGKFGEGKRFYGLGLLKTRLEKTCEAVVAMQLFVLNMERKLRLLFYYFTKLLFEVKFGFICAV